MAKTKEKRENHTKPLRLFKIEQAIQNMSYPNVDKLVAELGVSRRTILRDIDELKIYYDAPIEYDPFHKGYYYTDNTYFVKNMMLTESEVFAVTGILPLMERYNNTPLKKTINKVYIKSQIKMYKTCGIKMYNYSANATQSFSL